MAKRQATVGVKVFLFFVFLIGIGLNIFFILDVGFNWPGWIKGGNGTSKNGPTSPPDWGAAKRGVVFIVSYNCDNQPCGNGTGFVVEAGYIATNVHVLRCGVPCERFKIMDYKGIFHDGRLEGIKTTPASVDDLAILSIQDYSSLLSLKLADSAEYETGHDGEEVVTIGYPLVGYVASPDKASLGGKGTISTFKTDTGMFVCSGTHFNPGNSGGPVFHFSTKKVIGIAQSKLRERPTSGQTGSPTQSVDSVDYFIPINRFKDFFEEKIGNELK